MLCALGCSAAPALALNDGLARTPPMGWNGWYYRGCAVTETTVTQSAAALVRSGMRDAGYRYVNLDDCWMAWARDANGDLQPDHARFPHGIAALARTVHASGMKLGIYLSAGPTTCTGRPGSSGLLARDIATAARWGIDFVKLDWCAAPEQGGQQQSIYGEAQAVVAAIGRPMLLSISEMGDTQPWTWGAKVGHMWRTTPDVTGYDRRHRWRAALQVASLTERVGSAAGPGGWNDADILQVGLPRLTPDENRALFSVWAMLAAPLIAGNNVRDMSADTRATLVNPEVIAIDQDRLGRAGKRVAKSRSVELWVRELAGGDRAFMVLNRRAGAIHWKATAGGIFGRANPRWRIRDLWAHRTTMTTGPFTMDVPGHAAALFRVGPA
jgi:alpha-galactosidase